MEYRIFIRKNDKNIEANKKMGNDKLPVMSIFLMPEDKDSKEFREIGAAWRAKSGKGFTGVLDFDKGKLTEEEKQQIKALRAKETKEEDLGF